MQLELAYDFALDCYKDDFLPTFCTAVLNHANSWPLQICHLDGNFGFEAAVELLPVGIKHLQMTGYQARMPQGISLSKFARFTDWETLVILLSDGDDGGPRCPVAEDAQFELELELALAPARCRKAMAFLHLRHVFLFPWCIKLGQGCTFDSLLPRVWYAAMLIPVRQAKPVMLLVNLECLSQRV